MYNKPFHLSSCSGNNIFSYDIREKKTLFVPNLIEGILDNVILGTEIVFSDVDESGKLLECLGLQYFVRTRWHSVPMIIFDNHNHAFFFWHEAKKTGVLKDGATLVHIDEHSDLHEPEMSLREFLGNVIPSEAVSSSGTRFRISGNQEDTDRVYGTAGQGSFDQENLSNIFRYTNEVLQVGSYIRPAEKDGLIGKTHTILSEGALLEYENIPLSDNLILNLDLDFFEPRLESIPFELKKKAILHFASHAKLITIATSPFFIDQKLAIDTLHKLFD